MWFFLGLTILLGGFLRGFGIDKVPPEMFGDEIDAGYHAYSLLKTGRDTYGQVLPMYVHSFSEWKAPLYMYAAVPTVAVFGLNEWGVKLPATLAGVLAIPTLFLLVYTTSKNKYLALLSSLVLAITPWHIYYARAALEVELVLFLGLLATLTWVRHRFGLAAILFAATIYVYNTALLFVPLWLGCLILTSKVRPKIKDAAIFLLLVAPMVASIFFGPAAGRFKSINVTSNPDLVDKIIELRKESGPLAGQLFHNKAESFVGAVVKNYVLAFSTDFLFLRGDPIFRHSIQVTGQLLPVFLPFVVIGLYFLAKQKQWLWLGWLVLAPIPSALTIEGGYHALRLIWMVPPLVVATAYGLERVLSWCGRVKVLAGAIIALVIGAQFVSMAYFYWVHYPKQSWRWWSVGYKGVLTEMAKIESGYRLVFMNNTYELALPRFLVWTKYHPATFHRQFSGDQSQANILPGWDGFALGTKYYFGTFTQVAKNRGWDKIILPGNLYILSQRDDAGEASDWRVSPPVGVKVLYTSTNAYNQPIFYLVTANEQ